MCGCMHACVDKCTDCRTDGLRDRQTDARTDSWRTVFLNNAYLRVYFPVYIEEAKHDANGKQKYYLFSCIFVYMYV